MSIIKSCRIQATFLGDEGYLFEFQLKESKSAVPQSTGFPELPLVCI